MNTLILECKKFIRSRIFVVILGVILVLLASLFYKNYLNYQQVDTDKKHELLMIKKGIGDILYPADGKSPCRYSADEEKMDLLKKSLEISEKTLKLKHSGDDRGYMESAILMYEKIIEIKENEINFSISEYEEKIVDNSNLEKQAEENEQNIIIKNTLKTLKKEEYTVFIMFYYENRTTKEIAEYLNCTVGNVKVILHRVRKK